MLRLSYISLNVGQISLQIEMIICKQICCKIGTFGWPLDFLTYPQNRSIFLTFLRAIHGKTSLLYVK